MLVITRKAHEGVVIDNNITVVIDKIKDGVVYFSIQTPDNIQVQTCGKQSDAN